MPMYLTRFSYTPATWARMVENPEDRRKAASAYIESVGGKLHGFWYAFGEHDGYNLWEAPDNVSMASVVLAIGPGGALSPARQPFCSALKRRWTLWEGPTRSGIARREHSRYRPVGTCRRNGLRCSPKTRPRAERSTLSGIATARFPSGRERF